jgi:hypothetical protein
MSKILKLEGPPDEVLGTLLKFMGALDNPIVYIGDLVQNALDARATQIKITLVKKGKTTEKIICSDNGVGFEQSFEKYSKSLTSSIKKRHDYFEKLRAEGNLRGEFCIGLYGFASLCNDLSIVNISQDIGKMKDTNGNDIVDDNLQLMYKCRRMRISKQNLQAIVDEEGTFETDRVSHGVTVILSNLTETTRRKFTVQRIVDYVSNKNRSDLLKKTLKIEVTDGKITQKVEPHVYKGEKVITKTVYPDQKDIRFRGHGSLDSELYYHHPRKGSTIIVTVKGEPIYNDLCKKVEGFDKFPWNSGMVSGTVEYDRLSKQPGREGVQKDISYDVFIDLLKILEPAVEEKVKLIEDGLQSKDDDLLNKRLHEAFINVRKDTGLGSKGPIPVVVKGSLERIEVFPDKETVQAYGSKTFYVRVYDDEDNELTELDGIQFYWSLTGKLGKIFPQGRDIIFDAEHIIGTTDITVTVKDTKFSKELSRKIEIAIINPIDCGGLHRVRISPEIVVMSFNKHKNFVAIAEDANGNVIGKGIKYSWNIVSSTSNGSEINKDKGDSIIFVSGKVAGQVKIRLVAQHGILVREDFVSIDIKDVPATKKNKKGGEGVPRLEKVSSFEYPMWHSKLDENVQVLYCNTEHKDYAEVKNNSDKRHKYIANLYAKELTLVECRDSSVAYYGERLLEIMSSLNKHWDLLSK